jgi:hypothetical protein
MPPPYHPPWFETRFVRNLNSLFRIMGHAVALLVGALCYKPEGSGFDSPLSLDFTLLLYNQIRTPSTHIWGIGIAQSVQRRAMGWTAGVRFPAEAINYLLHSVQTGSEAHPASYTMGIGGSFSGCKAAGTWNWSFTSILVQRSRKMELYLHSPIRFMAWCLIN